MDPRVLNIGDTVEISSVGPGKVTGFNKGGFPEVDGKAVGNLTRTDGAKFGPTGSLKIPRSLIGNPNPVAPTGLARPKPTDDEAAAARAATNARQLEEARKAAERAAQVPKPQEVAPVSTQPSPAMPPPAAAPTANEAPALPHALTPHSPATAPDAPARTAPAATADKPASGPLAPSATAPVTVAPPAATVAAAPAVAPVEAAPVKTTVTSANHDVQSSVAVPKK